MNYRESLIIGLEGLKSHLLRSILSMLGIIFGVGAVIAMLSIGEGAKYEALEQIKLMGMNNIIVQDVPVSEDELDEESETNKTKGLTYADARVVQELNPLIAMTVPVREMSQEVRFRNEKTKDCKTLLNEKTLRILETHKPRQLPEDKIKEIKKIEKSWFDRLGLKYEYPKKEQ